MIIKEVEFRSDDYSKLCDLRNIELRVPLGLKLTTKDKEGEESQHHFGVFEDDEALACLILKPLDERVVKMRQVCTARNFQGKSLGSSLLEFAENWARQNGFSKILCHARESASPYYLKKGYAIEGAPFEEIGIPHYYMVKNL